MIDYWDDKTPIEEYNVFAGEMAHPRDQIDAQHRYHDPYMIDLQPSRDAVHEQRMQREARHAEQHRERLRAKYEEHGEITKMISGA